MTYQETPVFESAPPAPVRRFNKGHALVGIGLALLLVQAIPGGLFFPLVLLGAGWYFVREEGARLNVFQPSTPFTRGHALFGLGLLLLALNVLPGGLVLPLALVAGGAYLLRKHR